MREARYLRVKDWGKHQHYRDKEPGWIKMYAQLLRDSAFAELTEMHQWQLVRLWLIASQSGRFTLEPESSKIVPVLAYDSRALRRAIGTLKTLPLDEFVNGGWLVVVPGSALVDTSKVRAESRASLDSVYTAPSPPLSTRGLEKTEEPSLVVLPRSVSDKPKVSNGRATREIECPNHVQTLLDATRATGEDREKIIRASRGKPMAAIVAAREAAQGPGVRDRLAVALSELAKRRNVA